MIMIVVGVAVLIGLVSILFLSGLVICVCKQRRGANRKVRIGFIACSNPFNVTT